MNSKFKLLINCIILFVCISGCCENGNTNSLGPDSDSERVTLLAAVNQNGLALKDASADLRADREIVLAAVNQNGLALQYANEELKADEYVVAEAVIQNKLALCYASVSKTRNFFVSALAKHKLTLEDQDFRRRIRANREFVLEAVGHDGCALRNASADLRADRDIVLEAVRQNGEALEFASEDLRSDQDVVLEAVRKNGCALEFASEDLRADRDVVLEAVGQNECALGFASEDLRADREFVLKAVQKNALVFDYVSPDFIIDREVYLTAYQFAKNDASKSVLNRTRGQIFQVDLRTIETSVLVVKGVEAQIFTIQGVEFKEESIYVQCNTMAGEIIEITLGDKESTIGDLAREIATVKNLKCINLALQDNNVCTPFEYERIKLCDL